MRYGADTYNNNSQGMYEACLWIPLVGLSKLSQVWQTTLYHLQFPEPEVELPLSG